MHHDNAPLAGRNFRALAIFTSAWILFLIFVGAYVRVTQAGMGCPDWPLCFGEVAPPGHLPFDDWLKAWREVAHRIAAGGASFLTLGLAYWAWRDYRRRRIIYIPALAAVGTVLFQAFLGAVTVWMSNTPWSVVAHLLAAIIYLAVTLFMTTAAHLPAHQVENPGLPVGSSHRAYFRFLLITGATIMFLLITGALVTSLPGSGWMCVKGEVLSFNNWPLCQGELFPEVMVNNVLAAINVIHRLSVVAVGVVVAGAVLQTRRRYGEYPVLVKWANIMGGLYLAQVVVGGLDALLSFPTTINALHLALAAAIWGSLVVLASLFYLIAKTLRPEEEEAAETGQAELSASKKAATYFKLTKPWILLLLLTTTAGAMVIAGRGMPPLPLLLYTLLGGALAAGGAGALNSYVDSDIDRVMSRTSRRPTVTGLVSPEGTLFFGLTLSTLSFLVFSLFVNNLSAALSTLGILYYVFFYTLYLKRATIHNIVVGGAAGALPPLVGWTAVTGQLDLGALYLFAIIFFWTPPHTWALALLVKKDYAQARVPMLPVIVGEKETTYQIFLYTILLITLTLLPFAAHLMGWLYLAATVVLGVPFLHLAWSLWRNYDQGVSKRLYKFSQTYLALLFLAMALDRSLF
jgi:protoheme IX farnesyltransferase